jgi:subtilisin family serine protease
LTSRGQRKRRTWTFEQLEERHFLSATSLTNLDDIQWLAVSSSTSEGQQLIDLLSQQWRTRTSGASDDTATNTLQYAFNSVPDDPYLQYQWNLLNVGQSANYEGIHQVFGVPGEDINVIGAWENGVTGAGVLVAVVDSGVQVTHPDLDGNISIYRYNALTGGTNVSPSLEDPSGYHGTAVAGLIAGEGNNDLGMVGVAYGADIMPILIGTNGAWATNAQAAVALLGNGAPVDIYSNSWGPANSRFVDSGDLFYDPTDPNDADLVALLQTAATQGRNGLGAIYVFSSGNDAGPQFSPGFDDIGIWDSAGSNFFVNSRYTIGVGMVDHDGSIFNDDGTVTLYSEAGPSVLIVAPSASGPFDIVSDPDTGSGIWSTDLTGDDGANVSPLPSGIEVDGDKFPDTNYTSTFGGTSAAAPQVSGVIALMLEANPNLTYRDVEEILVRSARQNSPFGSDTENAEISWIVNSIPLFRDPIPHNPEEPNGENEDEPNSEIRWEVIEDPASADPDNPDYIAVPIQEDENYSPIADPSVVVNGDRVSTSVPYLFTNGAGYTVSYGRYGQYATEYGYAHGVVDAELAVEMASQWHSKDQNLASELTYLVIAQTGSVPIRAAEVTSEETGQYRIPGGLGYFEDGFIEFFEEFFVEPDLLDPEEEGGRPTIDPTTGPFNGDEPPENTRGYAITVDGPSGDNAMAVEWVEVQLDISGGDNDMDFLRIILESPDGTLSELTNYQLPEILDSYQEYPNTVLSGGQLFVDPPDELDDNSDGDGTFSWIYGSNRNWGERGEGTWQVHFENYSDAEMSLDGLRVSFHGKPISVPNEDVYRVSGKVGLDAGYEGDTLGFVAHDGAFQFSRYYPNLEPYAAGVTIVASDMQGQVVSQFLVGADGNYYFDLPEGQYQFTVVDPEGRDIEGGAFTADPGDSFEFSYASSWTVNVGPDVANPPDPFDPSSIRGSFIEGVNFLLDPGDLPANEVIFEGLVFADLNGDGTQDAEDVGVPGFLVYADLNHTGQREASEPYILTESDGSYTLTVPTTTYNTFTIGVETPAGWQPTYPAEPNAGFHTIFADLGQTIGDDLDEDTDFGFAPPSTPTGEGNATILGFVFGDADGDGVFQEGTESGVANVRVFIDAGEMNGQYDVGETYALTSATGAFQFSNILPGTVRIDIVAELPSTLSTPTAGYYDLTLEAGEVEQGVIFGVRNMAVNDYGDLIGSGYRTTLAEDGARHRAIQGFSLGSLIDAELDAATIEHFDDEGNPDPPNPALNGIGDDETVVGVDDEDGIHAADGVSDLVLQPGINTLSVTLNGVGGYLDAWIDLNDDGDFDDVVSGISEQVIADLHRNTGTHSLQIVLPLSVDGGADEQVAARFRWSRTFGLDYYGAADIGEVEDYLFHVDAPLFGDYDGSGLVDEGDYDVWKANFGSTVAMPGTGADGNYDGVVDAADYSVWRDHLGEGTPPGAGALITDASESESAVSPVIPDSVRAESLQALLATRNSTWTPSPEYLAWIEQIGGTVAIVNGEYRFSYTSPGNAAATATTATESPQTTDEQSPASASLEGTLLSLNALSSEFTVSIESGSASLFVPQSAVLDGAASTANLQLLDEVLGQIASHSDDEQVDDLVTIGESDDQDGEATDLALAAVFEDEAPWWLGV